MKTQRLAFSYLDGALLLSKIKSSNSRHVDMRSRPRDDGRSMPLRRERYGRQGQGGASEQVHDVVLVEEDAGEPHAGRIESGQPDVAVTGAVPREHQRQQQRVRRVQRRDGRKAVGAELKNGRQGRVGLKSHRPGMVGGRLCETVFVHPPRGRRWIGDVGEQTQETEHGEGAEHAAKEER